MSGIALAIVLVAAFLHACWNFLAKKSHNKIIGKQVFGNLVEAIQTYSEAKQIDLIVMGSHGRRGLGKVLMGSVTERTIGYSPCPVLIRHPG